MTLNDLIKKAASIAYQLSGGDVPLYDEAHIQVQDIQFDVYDDNDGEGPYVQLTIK